MSVNSGVRLLFIKLKHIGDALLLTPALVAVKRQYPAAEISVLVRQGSDGILAGCPAIDHLFTTTAPERHRRSLSHRLSNLAQIRALRGRPFDYIFELGDNDRGRWTSLFLRASHRCANAGVQPLSWFWRQSFDCRSSFNWLHAHRVEKDFHTVADILPLRPPIPPLSFARDRAESWAPAAHLENPIVLHPATRWKRKQWPLENWISLGQHLLSQGHSLLLSCGPDPEEIKFTQQLQSSLGHGVLSTLGQLSWPKLAGLLFRAKIFVGVDTAAMHLAAACQIPVVAIFGPSIDWMWRPWQTPHQLVTPTHFPTRENDLQFLADVINRPVEQVSVIQVIDACAALLASGNRTPASNPPLPAPPASHCPPTPR